MAVLPAVTPESATDFLGLIAVGVSRVVMESMFKG